MSALTQAALDGLTDRGIAELARLYGIDIAHTVWSPQERDETDPLFGVVEHPQRMAYESKADIIGYGGSAGGGKTDLGIGKALTQHYRSFFLRREATQLKGVVDRLRELLGNDDGYRMRPHEWRHGERLIDFGSVPHPDDWTKHQGVPHDLIVFEEAANFLKMQVVSLLTWLRSTDPRVKQCQALLTFNPPTSAEGQWIVEFFAPWIDPMYPGKRAESGELRYFVEVPTDNGSRTVEVDGPAPVTINGEKLEPMSRTFIRAGVMDNRFLRGTRYVDTLRALPEPLRSQMLHGDFTKGLQDATWQVIPSAWVDLAMARWTRPAVLPLMDAIGVDVARGGPDNTVLARRHGMWFDQPIAHPGKATPDGPATGGLVIAARRDSARIGVDGIGVGGSVIDFLRQNEIPTDSIIVSESSGATVRGSGMGFNNQRSADWWAMREALDPANNTGICLPPDPRLRADLVTPLWSPRGMRVEVESRDEIVKRLGRSPDYAAAYLNALRTPGPDRSELRVREQMRAHGVPMPTRDAVSNARRNHNPHARR